MQYKVVYDLQTSDLPLTNYLFILPGAVIFIIGAVTYLFRDYFTNPFRKKPMPQRFPIFLLLFGALWMQLSSLSLYVQYNTLNRAIKAGKVNTIEGRVVHFSPLDYIKHPKEHFCISESEVCFSYSDLIAGPGFNQTTAHGGPIHNGLPVRVTYKDNAIVKLEVSEFKPLSQQELANQPPPEVNLSPSAR